MFRFRKIRSSCPGVLRLPLLAAGAAVVAGIAYVPVTAAPSGAAPVSTTYSVTVPGNDASWQDTGISVPFGATLKITAGGRVHYNLQGNSSSPIGVPVPTRLCAGGVSAGWAEAQLPCLSLIGGVGGGDAFEVGSSFISKHTEAGDLFLLYNDDNWGDNSGSFTVDVTVTAPAAATDVSSDSPGAADLTAASNSFPLSGTTYNVTVAGNNSSLTDTGISVPAGKKVTISATGTVVYNAQGDTTSPTGLAVPTETCASGSSGWYSPHLNCLSLIGQFGSGELFKVGTSTTVENVEGGELYLVFNDNDYGDNSGSFSVAITVS